MDMIVFFPYRSLLRNKVQRLYYSWACISFIVASRKPILSSCLMGSLNMKVSIPSSMLETRIFLELERWYGEDLYLFHGEAPWLPKSLFLEEWTWWQSRTQMQRGPWVQIYLVFHPSLVFHGLSCFVLILKCVGLYTLWWGGRTAKARRDLICLVNPAFMHLV